MVGGFNPSEKYESQLGLFFPIHGQNGQIKNVPNHQPVIGGLFFHTIHADDSSDFSQHAWGGATKDSHMKKTFQLTTI
jgi:hypothetical protein